MDTATTEETIYQRTANLAKEIWSSVFPHAEPVSDSGVKEVPREFRAELFFGSDGLSVGDVVLSVDTRGSFSKINRRMSIRDAATFHGAMLHLVTKVSAKSFMTIPLSMPRGWDSNLGTLGHRPEDLERRTATRYTGTNNTRDFVRLGTYDEIITKIQAHPEYGTWTELWEAAKAQEAEDRAQAKTEAEAARKEREPFEKAAKAIHDAIGEDYVVRVYTTIGAPKLIPSVKWASRARLEEVIAGRFALGRISMTTAESAKEALTLLNTKEN